VEYDTFVFAMANNQLHQTSAKLDFDTLRQIGQEIEDPGTLIDFSSMNRELYKDEDTYKRRQHAN
jgi:hypothetical protein